MRHRLGLALLMLLLVSCKTTRPEYTVVKVSDRDRELFTMQIRQTPPVNCCVCASDDAFDIDLSQPQNYCTEYFSNYENFCNALIIGPRNVSLEDVTEAVVSRIGEGACSGHLYFQTHGHSGPNTLEYGPMAQVRLCKEGNCLPEKLTLITTGCQAHKDPLHVEGLIKSLAEDTGIKFIESWGNQAYDPGTAGLDWTMSKVALNEGRSEFDYWPCKNTGTNCTMLGSYHHNMGWRCKASDGGLLAQFCCPSATREGRWDWAEPVPMGEGLSLPTPSC